MRDPVRVCLLNDHLGYGGTLHGVSRYFLTLVPRLDPSRVAPFVAILRAQEELTGPFVDAGIPVHFPARGRLDPGGLFALMRLLRSRRAEVVHAQGYAATTLARVAARLMPLRVVIHSHEADDRYPGWMRIPDRLLAGSESAALAVSEDARRFFEEQRGIAPGRTRVVPNGVDLASVARAGPAEISALREDLGVGGGTPLVLCVTRFRPEKGNDVLLRALPALLARIPGAVLAFAGEGPELDDARALARALGVDAAVRFLGFRNDVSALVSAADLVAVPSRREGSPFFVIEALALGAPIVASAVGGLLETLEDGVSARLFPSEDSDALAAALAELLERPEARRRLSEGALARARHFDLRERAEELTRLYLSLADEMRSSR